MNANKLREVFDDEFTYDEFLEQNSDTIAEINRHLSFLRMCLSYLESQQIQYRVDCRPNYKFYVTCGIHKNNKDTIFNYY